MNNIQEISRNNESKSIDQLADDYDKYLISKCNV